VQHVARVVEIHAPLPACSLTTETGESGTGEHQGRLSYTCHVRCRISPRGIPRVVLRNLLFFLVNLMPRYIAWQLFK